MEQSEFRELFKSNHKTICKNICDFFEVDLETLNKMLMKSYLSLAGGYARRLYMVQNELPLTDSDMKEYMNSDIDMFVYSIHAEEIDPPQLSDFEKTFIHHAPPQMANIHVSYQNEFNYSMYVGNKDEPTRSLHFKPIGNKLKSYNISRPQRPYTFYKDNLIMNSQFGKMSLFNIQDVSNLDGNVPTLQFIKTSKNKLKAIMDKKGRPKGTHVYSKILLSTFDMSQTRFYIHTLDSDLHKSVVESINANLGQMIYDCDISDVVVNNVNILSRVKKYSRIGMRYKKEDIQKLLQPNLNKEIGTSVIEGGYY